MVQSYKSDRAFQVGLGLGLTLFLRRRQWWGK